MDWLGGERNITRNRINAREGSVEGDEARRTGERENEKKMCKRKKKPHDEDK